MQKALNDPDRKVWAKAVEGLMLVGGAGGNDVGAESQLKKVTEIKDDAQAKANIRINGSDKVTVSKLRAGFSTGGALVKIAAVKRLAVEGLEPTAAVGALKDALVDGLGDVRIAAIDSLKQWGPLARPALPSLTSVLGDSCEGVISALRSIVSHDPQDRADFLESEDSLRPFDQLVRDHSAPQQVKDCFETVTEFHFASVGPTGLYCLAFEIPKEGADIKRLTSELSDGRYDQACKSAAIKRMMDAQSANTMARQRQEPRHPPTGPPTAPGDCAKEFRVQCDRVEAGEPPPVVFHELNPSKVLPRLKGCLACGSYARIQNTALPAAQTLKDKLEETGKKK